MPYQTEVRYRNTRFSEGAELFMKMLTNLRLKSPRQGEPYEHSEYRMLRQLIGGESLKFKSVSTSFKSPARRPLHSTTTSNYIPGLLLGLEIQKYRHPR